MGSLLSRRARRLADAKSLLDRTPHPASGSRCRLWPQHYNAQAARDSYGRRRWLVALDHRRQGRCYLGKENAELGVHVEMAAGEEANPKRAFGLISPGLEVASRRHSILRAPKRRNWAR